MGKHFKMWTFAAMLAVGISTTANADSLVDTKTIVKSYEVSGGFVTIELANRGDLTVTATGVGEMGGAEALLSLRDSELTILTLNDQLKSVSGVLRTEGAFKAQGMVGDRPIPGEIGNFEMSFSGLRLDAVDTLEFARDVFGGEVSFEQVGNKLVFKGTMGMGMSMAELLGDFNMTDSDFGQIYGELDLVLMNTDQFGGDNGPRQAMGGSIGHDVIVCALQETGPFKWGATGNIMAYSIATLSGNAGNVNLEWQQFTTFHPAFPQNFYRLKNGRMEQIGLSWCKHGFCALQNNPPNGCVSGCVVTGGCPSFLTPGCTDPYSGSRNGSQNLLGPHYQVNAWTGIFTYPPAAGSTGTIGKRLQVHASDLDPAQNAGATYYGEGMYVHRNDALDGNNFNNASYRQFNVGLLSGGAYTLTWGGALGGGTQFTQPAISAWKTVDPTVQRTQIDIPSEGRLFLYYKASDNGDGTWHYEYALYNMNSDRSVGSFSVPVPDGVNVTNIGFHDVDYHSGDPYSLVDWDNTLAGGSLTWSTDPYADNVNANALRWCTTYNFRFDADMPPMDVDATLGIFKPDPGQPDSIMGLTAGPTAPPPCPHDLDGDGDIGASDLALLLASWGPCACPADYNGSGSVDPADLATLLGNWGPC